MTPKPATEPATEAAFAYDRVAYPGHVIAGMAPAAIAAAAAFYGFEAPDAAAPSVLEVGCGDGLNLMAGAAAAPRGRFDGFDLSREAIARGRELARAAGLDRVGLEVADVCDPALLEGPCYGYVLAHGFYTWVPPRARAALLDVIAARLAPGGIAYVSYDCLPAAAAKKATADALIAFAGDGEPAERHARTRALVDMALATQRPGSDIRPYLDRLAARLAASPPEYFVHDDFAEHYDPVSLPALAAEADERGLVAVGDGELVDLFLDDLKPDVAQAARAAAPGYVSFAYMLDLLRGARTFRKTLLIRADAPPPRRDPRTAIDRVRLAASGVRRDIAGVGEAFAHPSDAAPYLKIEDPAEARVYDALLDAAPAEATASEIVARLPREDPGRVRAVLARAVKIGLVRAYASPQPFALDPGPRPTATGLARACAATGRPIVGLRFGQFALATAEARTLMALLDGTRDREGVRRDLAAALGRDVTPAQIDEGLAGLAARRVFLAD